MKLQKSLINLLHRYYKKFIPWRSTEPFPARYIHVDQQINEFIKTYRFSRSSAIHGPPKIIKNRLNFAHSEICEKYPILTPFRWKYLLFPYIGSDSPYIRRSKNHEKRWWGIRVFEVFFPKIPVYGTSKLPKIVIFDPPKIIKNRLNFAHKQNPLKPVVFTHPPNIATNRAFHTYSKTTWFNKRCFKPKIIYLRKFDDFPIII